MNGLGLTDSHYERKKNRLVTQGNKNKTKQAKKGNSTNANDYVM